MSSAFTTLISKIENYYADRDYTTEDAEHLSHLAIVEYAKTKNALVASARQVSETSVDNIIETAIHLNLDADPSEWMLFAANAVDNVLNYAHEGILASGLGEYTDFLPLGHPSRTNRGAMTASALSRVTAMWTAGDPRIASEQARLDVYAAYSTKPGTIEAEYAGAKLSALVAAGYVPEDVILPITAAFKMSFAMRSAMSKALAAVRRRHRDGKFAEEFGRLRGFFSRPDGSVFSEDGRIVGAPKGTNNFQVEFDGSGEIPKGVYTMDAAKTAPVKAILSKRALSKVKGLKKDNTIANPSKADLASAIPVDEFLKTRAEAPEGWTKNEDGSFSSKTGQTVKFVESQPDGDYMIEGAGENNSIDPDSPIFEIRDKNGELLGIGQNWSGLNKIAMTYDALGGESDSESDEPGFDKKVGEGDNWYDSAIDFDHLSYPENWTEDRGTYEYVSPDGKLKLTWDADGEYDDGAMRDLSGVSVEYDGQSVGGYLASYRDLMEGDVADGLKELLEKESWFSPDNLVKSEDFGNSFGFDGENGYVEVVKDRQDNKFVGWKVNKEASDLIDENREGFYSDTRRFKTKEEALAHAEEFAKILNDPDKLSNLLNETYFDEPGFDKKIGTQVVPKEPFFIKDFEKKLQDAISKNKFNPEPSAEDSIEFDLETGDKLIVGNSMDADGSSEGSKGSTRGYAKLKLQNGEVVDLLEYDDNLPDFDEIKKATDSYYAKNSDSQELGEAGKEVAKGLGDHKFFYEEDSEGNLTGGQETYTSPDGRVEVKYRDGSWFDDEKGYVSWDEMRVSVDGKPVETVLRNNRESWPDFLDRVAKMAENGLENPNYAQEQKDKREASRKAVEEFYNSPEQVKKREQARWEREQAEIAQEQAREAADKEGLLKKVDDLAKRIFEDGSGEDIWVGDEDEDGYRNWGVYNEDGDEVATGHFGPNSDDSDIASDIRDGINQYLDKKMDDEADARSGFDKDAPEKPLSPKMMEPATDKQYALLDELNSERDGIDPVTQKAVADALKDKNLTKAQMASLLGELTKKPFKPSIDPTKPTERQINSLQGYLLTKELSPEEMEDILAQLDAGLDRDAIEKLTAKLRRRPDRQQSEANAGFDRDAAPQTSWSELDEDQKEELALKANDFIGKWAEESPKDFMLNWFDFAKDDEFNPDGSRAIEKPYQYGELYLEYLDVKDPDMYNWFVGKLNSDDGGFDKNAPTKPLSPKMMEPATEAQYNYLKNLSETKADIDPETAQAIKEALESNNLTKAQAGAFIGKLRDLGDKENMGQYGKPSQKMIDSVNRDVYAKGLSPEDREEILNGLENRSKGDVSSIISMLKEMDDVEGGIEKYIDSLREKGDVEALKRLRADERYGRWSSQMDDALAKMDSGNQGFDRAAGKGYNPQINKDEYSSLAEEVENSEEIGYAFLNKEFVDGLDLNDVEDGYSLYTELMDAYKSMRPTSEEGKALEARLKQAADDLLAKIEAELGPIEAAKRDKDDLGSSFEFDNAVDDLPDFLDYYFPTDVSDGMRNGDGGSVGDVRGGGWEASLFQDEETGKWKVDMTSPGQDSESYSQEFDDQDEAADWAANELSDNNSMARNRDVGILAEDGLAGLIAEYGDDPEELAGVLEGVIGWLRGTSRGQADNIASKLGDYVDRLREQIAKNPKA